MPAVSLSPIFNGYQAFSSQGLPLSLGTIETYAAGTSTPLATYTTNLGTIANANPIALLSDGRPPQEIWLVDGSAYLFVLKDALGNQIGTYDNISGVEDGGAVAALAAALAASSGSSLVGFIQSGAGAVARTEQAELRERVSVTQFGAAPGASAAANDTGFAAARAYAVLTPCTIIFPPGTYTYSVRPNWNIRGVRLLGLGYVELHYTGTGTCWAIDQGAAPGDGIVFDVGMENFTITGTASASNGVIYRGVDHGCFKDIRVRDVTGSGHLHLRNTNCLFINETCSPEHTPFLVTPTNGINVDDRSTQSTSACTWINPVVEVVSGSGIKLGQDGVLRCTFLGGTSEGNGGLGIEIASGCGGNNFHTIDLEGNTGGDISCAGVYNGFFGVLAISSVANDVRFLSGAIGNSFHGGQLGAVTFDAGANYNSLHGTTYATAAGAYTDNGYGNTRHGTYNQTTAAVDTLKVGVTAVNDGGALALGRRTLTYTTPVAVPASTGNEFDLTVTNGTAFTVSNPTGPVDGQRITITVRNTSGGAMGAITWSATYKLAAWTNPANGFSRSVDFKYNGTNWVEISRTTVDVPN